MTDLRRDSGSAADALSARLAAGSRVAPRSPTEALQPEAVPPPPLRSRAVRHPLVVFLNFVLTIVVIVLVGGGAALMVGKSLFDKAGPLDQSATVVINKGDGLDAITDKLQNARAINSPSLFRAGIWFNNHTQELKPGEYVIPAHASMKDIMDTMVSGKGGAYMVTIPEGLTSEQVIACMTADSIADGQDIPGLNADQEAKCRQSAADLTGPAPAVPPEGSLMPDTYAFSPGDTRENLVARMRRERDQVLTDVWARRAPDLPLASLDQLVVLASIVEKETAIADERSRVAAVFINRLRLNMRLQSDPTVVYGMFGGKGKPADYVLSKADLDKQSPYNTYVVSGLPPGPIANPGKASLEAVANPSRTRDLYFVADGSGGHAFAETYEDHLRNVARWRQISGGAGLVAPDAAAGADSGPATPAPAGGATPAAADAGAQTNPTPAPAPAPPAKKKSAPAAASGPMELGPKPTKP